MDERLRDIVENLDSIKIGLDETFKFHCKMCGNCCINREDILLSPKDLYAASCELKIPVVEFFDKYCEGFIGVDSRIPLVRLRPKGADHRCPLLKKAKCRVHRAKPTVCAMFPIGRCLIADEPQEGLKNISQDQVQYLFTNPACGDAAETHTVREWLEAFGVPIEDEFFLKWQQAILEMGGIFRELEKVVSQNIMEQVWNAALDGIYLSYDTEQEFMSQFEENTKKFLAVMNAAFSQGGDRSLFFL